MEIALSSQAADKPPVQADSTLPIKKQRFKAVAGLEQTPTGNPQGKRYLSTTLAFTPSLLLLPVTLLILCLAFIQNLLLSVCGVPGDMLGTSEVMCDTGWPMEGEDSFLRPVI